MLVASNEISARNIAWITRKSDAPFFCPHCNTEVILRKGKIREHHFAHKPPVNCIYGSGESQKHFAAKHSIYDALKNHKDCSKCGLERRLKGVRPDISLYIRNTPVAIEVQKSTIDIDTISNRMQRYSALGIYVLWVFPDDSPKTFYHKKGKRFVYRIKEWEKYIHALYFGRVYYWSEDAVLSPYHFDTFKTWVDSFDGYNQDGEEVCAGGYYRKTKTLKVPKSNGLIHLVDNFMPIKRDSWASHNWNIPSSRLWIDEFKQWWKQ